MHTDFSPHAFFPRLWLPPCLSFWLSLFQQSQLITPYCCRQLQTTTNLEFHYSKLFHMCIQGPGRLGWPRFRKKQPPTGTHPPSPPILPTQTTIFLLLLFLVLLLPSSSPKHAWITCLKTPPFLSRYTLSNLQNDPMQRFHFAANAKLHQ